MYSAVINDRLSFFSVVHRALKYFMFDKNMRIIKLQCFKVFRQPSAGEKNFVEPSFENEQFLL